MERIKYTKNIRKVVIKIGTSSLSNKDGILDLNKLNKFVKDSSKAFDKKADIIIVTSGAIAAGLGILGYNYRPTEISILQAAAAVGQVQLMNAYKNIFNNFNINIGQILLTRQDMIKRAQYLNIKNTINRLLELRVVPIINENDSVAVEEIKFGDNDRLAAMVAALIEADILIILSDIDGLYDSNPLENNNAKLISFVEKITPTIERLAGETGSKYSLGGMVSKIKAAKICSFSGIPVVIANASQENVIERILNFEPVGTFFAPQAENKIKGIKKWIAFGGKTRGSIIIDNGAAEAILKKGKSILPVGIISIEGNFVKGDTLRVCNINGKVLAKGICNYSSDDLLKVLGKNDSQIKSIFLNSFCSEVIHRDNLVVFNDDFYDKEFED